MKFFSPYILWTTVTERKAKIDPIIHKFREQITAMIHDKLSEISTELQSVDISNMSLNDTVNMRKLISDMNTAYWMQQHIERLSERLLNWHDSPAGIYFTLPDAEVNRLIELSDYYVSVMYSEMQYTLNIHRIEWDKMYYVLSKCEALKVEKEELI